MAIHTTAIIDPSSEIDPTASIGPYCLIGPRVVVGPETQIIGHVFIDKDTVIGKNCRIFPFASLGADPQDLKYAGESSRLIIGDNVTIRESVTVHRGTLSGGGYTEIGDGCLLMATVHVAHDCRLSRDVVLSSFAVLAGHVHIEERAIISGSTAVHQFVHIGSHAFVGGMSGPAKDVPPYMIMAGVRDKDVVITPNLVGLRRHNFPAATIEAITNAYRAIHNHKPIAQALAEAEEKWGQVPEVANFINFYRHSERGVYR
ncbi:MAG: acyl-ACP--UDP-N-acetylglucosamine O-acyltransferase [Deltaproteobacteria bacterium]|jgi:UDP-N-acetylglucosamine acyltransferase|nr:acyl-ACP--UDP-N-acetylglucosamine O-acyltransferase [Deltaproteobacteria bacterium]